MDRKLIEDLHQYFEQKENRTGDEVHFLNELTSELPYFQISSVSREDLEGKGFNIENVTDEDMRQLARKLGDDYCNQLFWESMEIIAEQGIYIPRHLCPKCGNSASQYDSYEQTYYCCHCHNEWKRTEPTGRYVKVEFPEDSAFFDNHEFGYPCFNSEDNGARYVPEHIYIGHFGKEPAKAKLYQPIEWPESQQYFELPKSKLDKCEFIESGEAFDDFGSQAIWVPLSLTKKQ